MMRVRIFNPQAFLEFLCCLAFSGVLFYLTGSGQYLTYVTPRMAPYLYFTALVMLIWAGAGLFRLFRPQGRARFAHCFVLAFPMVLLLLPHNPLGATDLSYRYVGNGDGTGQISGQAAISSSAVSPAELPGLDVDGKKITVENDAFYFWLTEIYEQLDQYEGYQISMTGFVLKDPDMFAPDEFVPARLGMACCVADLVPYGMLCKYDKADELQVDAWVTVEGVIEKGVYDGWIEPQIAVTGVTPADEAAGYIYPF